MNALIERLKLHAPKPNLKLACGLLFCSYLLLMLARVVGLPGLPPRLLWLPGPVVGRIAVYSLALVPLFCAYVYAIYSVSACTGRPKLGRLALGFTALLSLPPVLSRDLFSNDVYGYIFYGRMVTVHGLNPYVTLPKHAPSDPYLSYVDWRNLLSPYGPLWTTWSALLDTVIPGGVRMQVFGFKLAAALTHVANTLLIGAILRKASPRNAALAMAAYGWNPLPVMEFAGNAHNDSLMLCFILSALLALYYKRPLLGTALLGAAVATKFTAVLFLPFYLVALFRGPGSVRLRLQRVGAMAGVILAVWVVSWTPYVWGGGWRKMLSLPEQSEWYLNSIPSALYALVRNLLVYLWGWAPFRAGNVADVLVTLVSVGVLLAIGLQLGRRIRERGDLVEMWYWFFFAYLVVAGPYFWPWYATTLVPLAALSRRPTVWLVTTVLSLSVMWVYSCSGCRTYINSADSPLTGIAIFALPLLTVWLLHRHHAPRPAATGEGIVPHYG